MLKIICYNILRGGQFEAGNRLGQIIEFLKSEKPHIVGLYECDQFEANDFKIAKYLEGELGMKLFLGQTRSKSHIAILYNQELTLNRSLTFDRFMYHGLMAAEFRYKNLDFRVVSAHLNPYSSELRLIEAQVLTQVSLRAENTLIMGDFNCPPVGSQLELNQFKKTMQSRITNELRELDTRGVQHIINNGFADLWLQMNPGEPNHGTYPTKLGDKDKKFPYPLRIDFFFGSEIFQESCKRCEVIHGEALDKASDHYPIIAEFDFE